MPNTAPEKAPRDSIGSASPREAWQPFSPPPRWQGHPRAFVRWLLETHRSTLKDNPIYRKTARIRYVRRARRFSPFIGDLLRGLVFGALAILFSFILLKFQRRVVHWDILLYYPAAVGSVFLVSLGVAGWTLGRRAGGFIKSFDRAMGWEDIAMTPLREDHFLWAWIWSPVLTRFQHVGLAVGFGTFGVMISPLSEKMLSHYPVLGPWAIVLGIFLSLLFLTVLAVVISLGVVILSLMISLDLGPRLYDIVGTLWYLMLAGPLICSVLLGCGTVVTFLQGVFDEPIWLYTSVVYSVGAICLGAAGDWLLVHQIIPMFWDSIVARRHVRYQVSWWRALMGK